MWGLELWGKEAIPHYLAGFLTPLLAYVHSVLTVLTFLGFMIYELQEWIDIKDLAWRDINEYMVGLYTSSVILLILCTNGVILAP